MKALIVYYSNTGSNKYLAEKIAQSTKSDIEAIRPRMGVFPVLMLFSLLKTGMGIKALNHPAERYDRIILCGPIWMGRLISPLRDFINRYQSKIKTMCFVTCCASTDAAKLDTFGHGLVFEMVRNVLGDKCVLCEAFPIGLVIPEELQKDGNAIMKTRLSDGNFTGKIQERFESFVRKIAE